ncbi:MAG: FmdB family zinc ribbon protein [Planctomycetota bacterium]|jgi:putative FmdB family regulatory protein
MPFYEYTCNKCNEKFELLCRSGDEPDCPKCKSKDLKKHISAFNGLSSGQKAGGSCCNPKPRATG